jgi:hypothetical protein
METGRRVSTDEKKNGLDAVVTTVKQKVSFLALAATDPPAALLIFLVLLHVEIWG